MNPTLTTNLTLLPIGQTEAENKRFMHHPDCRDSLYQTLALYERTGYQPPWIGYYVELQGNLVGMAAYVGKPRNGKVEIAYGTFPTHQQRGIGTQICRELVRLALRTDAAITIIAHTLPAENFSTRILGKNGFALTGTAHDADEGEVWEWTYQATTPA